MGAELQSLGTIPELFRLCVLAQEELEQAGAESTIIKDTHEIGKFYLLLAFVNENVLWLHDLFLA